MNVARLAAFFCLVFSSVASAQQTRFDRWDRDRDGRLTRDELPERLRDNFKRVDKNGDGFISRSEDAAVRERTQASQRSAKSASEGLRVERNISYARNENPRQQLDLLLPESRKSEEPLPVVVFIHGGGWRRGNRSAGHSRLAPFVRSGQYAGVSVGYRLSGEAHWPAQIHDCKAAIRWVRANAKRLKLDAKRIGVWGTSAGGHLVAMLGVSGGVAKMEGEVGPHSRESSAVQCVVDFFGPTDFLLMNKTALPSAKLDHDAPQSPESLLIGGPIQQNRDKVSTANPLTYVTKDDPPILIAHGVEDPLVSYNQSELLHRAYQSAKAKSVLVTVKGGGHGWRSEEVDKLVARFFAHHLRDKKSDWRDLSVSVRPSTR